MTRLTTTSDKSTREFGARLAAGLRGGEVIALSGELGAGKTTLIQGLASALGVQGHVNSPTFVIMKVYPAAHGAIKRLVHIDAYRLASPDDLSPLGLDEYLGAPDTVVAIEWADKIKAALPPGSSFYHLSHANNKRIIEQTYTQTTEQ